MPHLSPPSLSPWPNLQQRFWLLSSNWQHRNGRRLISLLLVVLLTVTIVPGTNAEKRESRVLPQLLAEANKAPEQTFRVIVTRIDKKDKADKKVKERGGKKVKDLAHDAFVAELSGREIEELGADDAVKFVAPDAEMIDTAVVDNSKLMTDYPATVNAPELWSRWTGLGVGVAVLDSGISNAKNDFNDAGGRSRIAIHGRFSSTATSSSIQISTSPSAAASDGNGHGTHVAGVIAGNSWNSANTTQRGQYVGIAPEAKILNLKVADDTGKSYLSDVVNAIDWVIKNRTTYNIRVLNMSLISSVAESYTTSTLAAAVERAWFSGILVVVSAGNNGPNTLKYPPANDPFVITVGAEDTLSTKVRSDDGMAPWSSYGTSQDNVIKPDVVAPGRYMVAPLASTTSLLARDLPSRVVATNYIKLSGTSMAAPVVSGIAALAFQAHPEWTNDQLKWVLMQTATKVGPSVAPLPGQGKGLVNAAAVVNYTAIPQRANQGVTINQQLVGPDGAMSYTNNSTASWATSSWSTASWATANWSSASWATANPAGSSLTRQYVE